MSILTMMMTVIQVMIMTIKAIIMTLPPLHQPPQGYRDLCDSLPPAECFFLIFRILHLILKGGFGIL